MSQSFTVDKSTCSGFIVENHIFVFSDSKLTIIAENTGTFSQSKTDN